MRISNAWAGRRGAASAKPSVRASVVSRPMRSTRKKIAAIILFSITGFLGGWTSQAQAAPQVYPYLIDDPTNGPTYLTIDHWSSTDLATICASGNEFNAWTQVYVPGNITKTSATGSFCSNSPQGTINTGSGFFKGGQYGYSYGDYRVDMYHSATLIAQFFYTTTCQTSGCFTTPPSSTASTTIDSITPSGTIASSSPITVTIGYHIGTTDYASSTAAGQTIRVLSRVSGTDTSFTSQSHTKTVSADGAGTFSYTIPTDLPAGQFSTYVSITSYTGSPTYNCDALATGGTCVPIGGINVASTTAWTLNTSYIENLLGTTTASNLVYKNAPCGISDLSGCFQNALAALFYPTITPGAAFNAIQDDARGRFPFVYVYQLGDIRTSLLTASSTAATSVTINLWKLGSSATTTINLISQSAIAAVPFSGTIYTVLTWLIWLGMAEYIYYRVIRMHDTHTP